jgi:hypothetical protein
MPFYSKAFCLSSKKSDSEKEVGEKSVSEEGVRAKTSFPDTLLERLG